MQVSPEKFDLQFWKDIARLLAVLGTLAFGVLGGTGGIEEAANTKLLATEKVISAEIDTDTSYEDYHELVRYHAAQDASCDAALEAFSRHRADERDFRHMVEECHSEGGVE